MDERPVDVVLPDVALVGAAIPRTIATKADHKVHAVGQRATQSTVLPTWKVRSRAPSSVHSFAVMSLEPLTKRALPGSTATAQIARVCAVMALARAVAHTLTSPLEPVMTRPSGVAARQYITPNVEAHDLARERPRLHCELHSVAERMARRRHCSDVVGERQLVEHEAQGVRRQVDEPLRGTSRRAPPPAARELLASPVGEVAHLACVVSPRLTRSERLACSFTSVRYA